ncbi:MAG: flagellar biosynthetic protein FliO [Pseudomonadales bacterium]|jgi:flagellar protein FliO/FliZ|nr:flagellar biosynthetic protein FliO [Pseudomonadales bacterium]
MLARRLLLVALLAWLPFPAAAAPEADAPGPETASEGALAERPAFLAGRRAGAAPVREPADGAGSLLRLLVGLAVVLGTLFALAWLVRRSGAVGVGRGGAVRVLASAAVGQRERVVLLEVGTQQLLVGVAPGSVRTLVELSEPVAVAAAGDAGAGAFASQLQGLLRRGETVR